MKHCIILGTRPEIIKMSSTIRALEQRQANYFVIHSNQHYSQAMDTVFFQELDLPLAKYNLNVGSGPHGAQTAMMLEKIESILLDEQPDVVYVEGDTNTVLAGALAASKLRIKVAHVEAGLRSYDREMPEETNRVITDHIADLLFPPTQQSAEILRREAIPAERIFVVGNTITDAVLQALPLAEQRQEFLTTLQLQPEQFILLTMHRPANVDSAAVLTELIGAVDTIAKELHRPVIFPLHPRTKASLTKHHLQLPSTIRPIEPCGFLEMLLLEKNSALILTDSGGIQEEACIMQKKCVTLRENTERPESVEVGGNILGGITSQTILPAVRTMMSRSVTWSNPFGDGTTGQQMIDIAEKFSA